MAKCKRPMKPGYCIQCGAQTMVTDTRGRPYRAVDGSKWVWLCLCDSLGNVKTRVGQLHVCKGCAPNLGNMCCETIRDNILHSRHSGVGSLEPEINHYPHLKLEVIKTFGE